MTLLPAPDADTLRRLAAERLKSRQTPPAAPARPTVAPAVVGAVAVAKRAKTGGQRPPAGKAKRGRKHSAPLARPLLTPLALTVPGAPVTKKNSPQIATNRKTGRPFVVPSPQYRRWAAKAKGPLVEMAKARGSIAEPVCLTATIYRARRVGDLVNYLQATCDLLQDAGVLENDSWVVAFDGSRLACDPANPRVEITLTPLDLANAA